MRVTRGYCTKCRRDVAAAKSLGRGPRCIECGSIVVRGLRRMTWKGVDHATR